MFEKIVKNSKFEDEQDDLHLLCQKGSLGDIITYFQSSPRGSKVHWYYEGQTALHTTALSGRKDVCDILGVLLDHGADINAQTIADGNTALHLVVLFGVFPRDVDTIVFLLERRADLNIRNKKLRTPYDCAIADGHYELAGIVSGSVSPDKAKELYIQRCKKKYGPEIIQAVLESNETKLKNSIELGGDPNVLNTNGAGAIHYTITHCQLPVYDTLLLLLESGADVNLRDEEGDTALNLVIKNSKLRDKGIMVKCVQLLIDWGAWPDLKDVDGKNAHEIALEKNYADVSAVLKKKPRKMAKNKREKKKNVIFIENNLEASEVSKPQDQKPATPTPVIIPTETTPTPVVPEAQVAPETKSPILLQPIKSLPEVTLLEDEIIRHKEIKRLLEEGVDINQRQESSGNTALHICAEKNYGSTAQLLLDHNIDSKIVNKNGKTAYVLATMNKSLPVIKAIYEKQKKEQGSAQESSSCVLL